MISTFWRFDINTRIGVCHKMLKRLVFNVNHFFHFKKYGSDNPYPLPMKIPLF